MFSNFRFPHSFLLFLLCVTALLSGCALPDPSGKPMARLSYAHASTFCVLADVVEITDARSQSSVSETEFGIPLFDTLNNYLRGRVKPIGDSNATLSVAIEESSITKSTAESGSKVARFLDVGSVDTYNMEVVLDLQYHDHARQSLRGQKVRASRSTNISEHDSIADTERKQFEALEAMLKDMDVILDRSLNQELQVLAPPEMRGEQHQNCK